MELIKKLKLKKDWPPFPKGTIFSVKRGCADEMLCSPTFGEIMPNNQPANGMIPRNFTEYTRHFEHVGGLSEWFDLYNEKLDILNQVYDAMIESGFKSDLPFMEKFMEVIDDFKQNKL